MPFGHPSLVDNFADIQYADDMGLTHADFFRLLPSAMGDHAYRIEGNTVYGDIHQGTVEIVMGEQQVRRIALMAIPFARVSFHFRGVSAAQQSEFKAYFDLRFQRGGG